MSAVNYYASRGAAIPGRQAAALPVAETLAPRRRLHVYGRSQPQALTPLLPTSGFRAVSGAGGIASGEAFGSPTLTPTFIFAVSGAGGIASGEAFGSPAVSAGGVHSLIDAGDIASGEAFGVPVVSQSTTSGGGGGGTCPSVADIFAHDIGGMTTEQLLAAVLLRVTELHRIHGLEAGVPLTVTTTQRQAGSIVQGIAEAGGTVSVERA